MFVTDPEKRARIGEASRGRSTSSAEYLAANMGRAPVLMIPCIAGRTDAESVISGNMANAGTYGSIIPAAWNFMLAARARGLGTAWTTPPYTSCTNGRFLNSLAYRMRSLCRLR